MSETLTAPATALAWSDSLVLHQPQMDHTHQEFVALLARAREARDTGAGPRLVQAFDTLVEHTVAHFAQEERWMSQLGFAAENCHAFQHAAVLNVLRECLRRARDAADFEPMDLAVTELAIWFPQHAQTMDAGLAALMAERGFDPASGHSAQPVAEGAVPITGCGSSGCG